MDRSDEYAGDRRDIVVNDAADPDTPDAGRRDVLVSDAADRDAAVRDRTENAADPEVRTGDVLGLGGSPVPKMPGDPSAEDDPEAASQRRARLRSGEAEGVSGSTPERTKGATGIDMGAGGSGTGLSGK